MTPELQAALEKTASSTKAACATSADVVKAAKPGTKIVVTGAKASIFTHSILFAAVGGVIVGFTTCYLVNKFWLNKEKIIE